VVTIDSTVVNAGLSLLFFFLVLFLQNAAGYSAVVAGTAALPVTALMFLLSSRFGALADRFGPRLFMRFGPIVMAAGLALLTRLDGGLDYVTGLLPPLIVFGVGLSMTVAPLTATVLADADEHNAGLASGLNNAIARVAGLLGIAIVGAIVAGRDGDRGLVGGGLPPRDGDLRRACGVRRRAGAGRHPQPPPPSGGGRLPGWHAGRCAA